MKTRLALFLLMVLTGLVASPLAAQDAQPLLATVTYNGITVSYDPVLGAVLPRTVAEIPPSDELMASYGPAHTAFTLIPGVQEGYIPQNLDFYPQLVIYKTDDIAAYNDELYLGALQSLNGLIEAGGAGDFSDYERVSNDDTMVTLPYLPVLHAGQIMRAQADYLPVNDGMGVRYLTSFALDVSPLMDEYIYYTFQGATNQFKGDKPGYYIAFSYPIRTGVLPTELPADFDYNTFSANYVDEMNAAIQKINAADPNTFSPTLAQLDALVQSITIAG